MKRGEIWTVAGGVYATKPRPALIIQDDLFDATDSITVLPFSTTALDAPLLRLPVPSSEVTGLRLDSQLMIDKITTVRRSNVQERIGRLTSQQLVDVERALLALLGLAA